MEDNVVSPLNAVSVTTLPCKMLTMLFMFPSIPVLPPKVYPFTWVKLWLGVFRVV